MKVGMFGKRRIGAQIGPRNSTPRNLSGLKKFEKLCLREKKDISMHVFFEIVRYHPKASSLPMQRRNVKLLGEAATTTMPMARENKMRQLWINVQTWEDIH